MIAPARGPLAGEEAMPADGDLSLAIGVGLWMGAAAVLLSAAALWIGGISSPKLAGALGALASAATSSALLLKAPQRPSRALLAVAGLSPLAIALAACALAGQFFDVSDDGLAYHQRGVIEIARGWNPIRDGPLAPGDHELLWVNHYAKGAWVLEASLYALAGRIEWAKGANLFLMVASGLLAFAALRALRLSRRLALWAAVLAAANPVGIYQALGFYVDGQLASALLAVLALFARQALDERGSGRPIVLSALAACLVYLSNLKFTGLVYAALIGAGAVAAQALLRRRRALAPAGVVALGCLLGILGPGYNPYVTNTLRAGHPFHPLMGAARVDIMSAQMVPAFGRLGRLEKLARGHFSRSSNDLGAFPRLKAPFTIVRSELDAFAQPDVRVGGFGPWFGGSLLVAAALATGLLVRGGARAVAGIGAVVFIGLTGALNPEAWWARYAPQLWLLPLLPAAWATSLTGWLRRLGLTTALALTVNVALVTGPYLREQIRATSALRAQLRDLVAAARGRWVATDLGGVFAVGVRLSEAGLAFERAASIPCAEPVILDSYPGAKVCVIRD
jgi:hypothetical protein